MKTLFAFILISAALFAVSRAVAQDAVLTVADFNKERNSGNIGGAFGTWDKDPNDPTQGCRMTFVKDDAFGRKDGMAIRLDYDVDSPNPAYNGFWIKLDNADISNYSILSFYVRGVAEKGFTNKIKVEVKDKNGGKSTHVVEGISEKWQKISIPIKFDKLKKKPFTELTIVFDDINSRPKQGAILIDDIALTGVTEK